MAQQEKQVFEKKTHLYVELAYANNFDNGHHDLSVQEAVDSCLRSHQNIAAEQITLADCIGIDSATSDLLKLKIKFQDTLRVLRRCKTALHDFYKRVDYIDLDKIDSDLIHSFGRRCATLMLAINYRNNVLEMFDQYNARDTDDRVDIKYITSELESIRLVELPYPNGLHPSLASNNDRDEEQKLAEIVDELRRFDRVADSLLVDSNLGNEDSDDEESYCRDDYRNNWAPSFRKLKLDISTKYYTWENNKYLFVNPELHGEDKAEKSKNHDDMGAALDQFGEWWSKNKDTYFE